MPDIMELKARLKNYITPEINKIVKSLDGVTQKNEEAVRKQKASNSLLSKSVGDLCKSWNVAAIAASSFVGAMGAMAVLNKVKKQFVAIRENTKEYIETQLQLRAALGYTSVSLDGYAEALQKQYVINDEVIRRMETTIAYFTKDEEQIKKLTKASLDFAAATGMDANSAAMLLGRSIESGGALLTRYGIRIKETNDALQRADYIIDAVNKKFGGQAEALASAADWWDRLKLTIEDTQEAVGLFFKKGFWRGELEKSGAEYVAFMEYNYKNAKNIMAESEKYSEAVLERARARIAEYESDPAIDEKRIATFKEFMRRKFDEMKKSAELTKKLEEELLATTDEGKIKLLRKQLSDELRNTTYTEEQKYLIRQTYQVKINTIQDTINEREIARVRELEAIMKEIDTELINSKIEAYDQEIAHYKTVVSAIDQLDDARIAAIPDKYNREIEALKIKHERELAEYEKNEEAKALIVRKQEIESASLDKKHREEKRRDDDNFTKNRLSNAQYVSDSSIEVMRNISKASKAGAAAQKVLDIAQATANMAIGITKASSGGVATMWQIPIIAAIGATQIALIASQKYQYGGIVPGNKPTGDQVPAMVNSGEMILNTSQQASLFDMISRPNSIVNNTSTTTNTPSNISLNINVGSGGTYNMDAARYTVDQLVPILGDALIKAKNEGRLRSYESAR